VGNSVEIDRIKLAIKKYRRDDHEKGQWVSEEQKERQIRQCYWLLITGHRKL